MDVGCYSVSFTRVLAGEPESASGYQVLGSTGVDVRFTGTLSLPDGVLAHFDSGFDLPRRSVLEAVGSEGVAFVRDPFLIPEPGIELHRGGEIERVEVEQADRYQLQLENFGDAIRGGADPLLGREDAVGQARAIELLYRAADEP
jgi:xylose dehydrogenase (NAD/NADP)